MKTTGYALRPRLYTGDTSPPSSLEDLSRYKNDGTFVNSPTWIRLPTGLWVNNFVGGSTQYISIPDALSLKIINNLTILAWIKTTSTTTTQFIFEKQLAREYGAYIYSDERLIFNHGDGSGEDMNFTGYFTSVGDDNWVFISIVRDLANTNVLSYKNGLHFLTVSSAKTPVVGTNAVRWGASAGASYPFTGDMWGQRILNIQLSADQIYNIFQKERGWFGV
jgi:hypothetical protein|tara:strand:- start:12681 stop:13343 length:663 start_codon:yes stop_codon:yes gene_type:complete